MVSHAEIRASNAQIIAAHLPRTAVFVGGTASIGKAALTALVSKNTPLKLYIIGRNKSSHELWLESLQQSNSNAEIVWLEGQVSLLAEVKRLCTEIMRKEERVDLFWLSAGFLPFTGRHGKHLLLLDL
jgi:NADP-dependent 3-hydroxy acid dehydrogenase YdfG